jgi:UDP-N-acetylglucosamine diphosphorylase / glucose-1-phosphate thymidylyltransferase / UDP-N-acetylgalactosamine diphosphorylase / glucosamine-1-phosphate N-acetyltransferase / galactosamine-1-phosphate N-acetyltransferase
MTEALIRLGDYIAGAAVSPLAGHANRAPWSLVVEVPLIVRALLGALSAEDYVVEGDIAIHRSATVETGAVLKGPLIVGPRSFIATGAYLRGGNWLDSDCLVGPGAELKASILFAGTKLAHFNFVGESVLGSGVNMEAGSIICNYRNERPGTSVRVLVEGVLHDTGVDKFGALVGDGCRIGANAVVAPGALLHAGQVVPRASLLDQELQ